MSLYQTTSLRTDMRQVLTPRMIQSMEILQMPLAALEERLEQELGSNPVLEVTQGDARLAGPAEADLDGREPVKALVVDADKGSAGEFERLERIGEYLENEEFSTNGSYRYRGGAGERDGKLDAMANSAARGGSLAEHLLDQWRLLDLPKSVRAAGEVLIGYIEPSGYLKTDLATIASEHVSGGVVVTTADLAAALAKVQTLEPAGVGARDLVECLLLQLGALEEDEEMAEGHDFPLERALVSQHLEDIRQNRYPVMSKKLGREMDVIKRAARRIARLNPAPGRLIGGEPAPMVTPDAIISRDEATGEWKIEMMRDPSENVSISGMYRKLMKSKTADKATKAFLTNNLRNARWLLESIAQRKSTIARVIRVVVDAQREFFENGPEHLKPLPMISVADQLGIHVATVSRAVSEKYIQTPRGIFPLRRFFSGGTTSSDGQDMSWDAVKEKIKTIIAEEDKNEPLGDEEIVKLVAAQGITLARRTVAKYRKILNIPTARQRRAF